jgi:spore germination protein YaaH
MSLPIEPIPQRRSNHRPKGLMISLAITFVIVFLVALAWYSLEPVPNGEHVSPLPEGIELPIAYQGKWVEASAMMIEEHIYLPLSIVNQWVDPDLVWDEQSSSVILTSPGKVIRMETEQLTAYVNDQPAPLRFPVEVRDQGIYLPMEPLAGWLGLSVSPLMNEQMVLVEQEGKALVWGQLNEIKQDEPQEYAIRYAPGIQSPIVADAKIGEKLKIFGEKEGWYLVQKASGEIGYVNKNDVTIQHTEVVQIKQEDQRPFLAWRPIGGKIHMTWEYVHRKTASPAKIGSLPSLNVISPTWFELLDGEGNIQSKADLGYVRWAHKQGIQVWGLFSNGFDRDRTHEVLSAFANREKMTKQLLAYAEMYELDGINIDFENVYLKDKAALVQWIREMTPLLHEQGLVVSMDITVKSLSENWSMFYDRPALAKVVDYLVLMAYDEHWGSSPIAGSVASLPWVERGVRQLIKEEGVSPSKIILGVPFYTRLWSEQTIEGETKVTSKAISMEKAEDLIKEKGLQKEFLDQPGQHFVSWQENDITYKIWFEDESSMEQRVDLVHQYRLAGLASWRRGFEKDGMLPFILEELKQRP